MSATHGKAGEVEIVAVAVGQVSSWTYGSTADEVDVTAMGDTAKSYLGGLLDGTFDIECFWDGGDAGQEDILDGLAAGTSIAVNLYPGGNTVALYKYSGDIVITSQEVSSAVDDAVKAKFSGRGQLVLSVISA